jgi:hypothetical protein
MGPNIEWTFNAYTIGSLIFAIAGFYWLTTIGMKVMKEDVSSIKGAVEKLTVVVTELAVQKKTIEHHGEAIASQGKIIAILEERLFKLSQGRGFIQDINGEYPRK